ncbi:ABC transporter permease [Vibrio coralliilyticus]|uniref:ABC transporter permease n=1 Tax=Vibrio coralliilyticus TaxID=190893 RepID=A0AAN0VZM5_9VIBR|nr:FtsX-like permease family protein [Vibrio coralliilyticus]AIW21815.1 ABC transporter permease [Vibrio coralliilyticus]NOH40486.1 ABC transporter permease [Vibrio coralliilyticus]
MGQLVPQSLRIAYLNLLRNRRRSVLSALIITIAVFALTSAGGFGLYTYESLQESTARDTGHLTISIRGFFEKDEDMPLANGLEDSAVVYKQLISNPDIRGIQPRIEFTGLVSNGNKSTIFVGTGVNEREFDMKGPFLDVRQGKTLSDVRSSRYQPSEPEVMLGVDLARNLNVSIGDWITVLATTSDGALNALDFKVHGIYSTGVPDLDKRQLYLHIESVQELLVSDKVSTLSVFLYETQNTLKLQSWVEDQLASLPHRQALEVTPWQQRAFFYTKVKDLYDRIFGIMGAVMSLVVFVALFNTMTMSVTERTREIGTLSALGTYPAEIVAGFVREAALLAGIGTLLGGLLTAATSIVLMVVDVQMPPPPGRTDGYPLNIYFSLELLSYSALGVMAICILAAFLSARKGVNKPITEALTYV